MLTEVAPTLFCVRVNGHVIAPNLPSKTIAEQVVYALPVDQRALAEIVPMTADGRSILLG